MESHSDVLPLSSFESLAISGKETSSSSFNDSFYTNRRSKMVSYKAMGSSPRSPFFFSDSLSDEETQHFLDSCYLCKKALKHSRDIYMYRGGTPFCSQDCRQEQIEIDDVKEIQQRYNKSKTSSTSVSQKNYERLAAAAKVTV